MEHFYAQLRCVSAYRALLQEPGGQRLARLFAAIAHGDGESAIDCYTALFETVAAQGRDSLGGWLLDRLRYGESPFAEAGARGGGGAARSPAGPP